MDLTEEQKAKPNQELNYPPLPRTAESFFVRDEYLSNDWKFLENTIEFLKSVRNIMKIDENNETLLTF